MTDTPSAHRSAHVRGRTSLTEVTEDDRNETSLARLDRHWAELLQEVRVVQTGVQLLTGFLLTLPFQARFAELEKPEQIVYLITVGLSAGSTAALIAPVALHRALFRRRGRPQLIDAAQRLALTGLSMLGLAITSVVGLIFDVVLDRAAGIIAASVSLAAFIVLWYAVPMMIRGQVVRERRDPEPRPETGGPPPPTPAPSTPAAGGPSLTE